MLYHDTNLSVHAGNTGNNTSKKHNTQAVSVKVPIHIRWKLTYMSLELVLEVLMSDDCRGGESSVGRCDSVPKVAEIPIKSAHGLRTSGPPEAVLGVPLVHPIQGETVEEGGILLVSPHLHELPFPVLVRLLEDGED